MCGGVCEGGGWSARPSHTPAHPTPPPPPRPAHPPRSFAVHKRYWRPLECLSLMSAAEIDKKEAAVRALMLSSFFSSLLCSFLCVYCCSSLSLCFIARLPGPACTHARALDPPPPPSHTEPPPPQAGAATADDIDAAVEHLYLSPSFKME